MRPRGAILANAVWRLFLHARRNLPQDIMKTVFRIGCVVTVLVLGGCAQFTPPPKGETIRRDLVYASPQGRALHLDLYRPESKSPLPLVLWIHGGGWEYGDKGFELFLRHLTSRGFAVASVQYRLSGSARYPAQIEDCRAAFNWLGENAGRYQLDPRHIFVAGASAGGHLAALLGLEEGRPKVKAVFVMYPATDLTAFPNPDHRRGLIPLLLGGSVTEKHALALDASPVNHVRANSPPFLILHGDSDRLVPIEQSKELDRRLRAAGVESKLVVKAGAGHGFGLTEGQLDQVATFFRAHFQD